MFISQLGWHWKHSDDFSIERVGGHYGTQLILVQSKAKLKMDATEYKVQKNTAFLITSCFPHCIYSDGEVYCDDWIRFTFEKEDQAFVSNLPLQFNVPIPLGDDGVSMLVQAAEKIFNSDAPQKKNALHHILCAILIHISEYTQPPKTTKHTYYDTSLENLRKKIYEDPAKDWSISAIAEELNISVSHFQRLYKNKFGVSCMNDVFMSRMEYAKQLLLTTELSANDIAEKCGYQNYEYFSRSFTKYACTSPVKYRSKYKE